MERELKIRLNEAEIKEAISEYLSKRGYTPYPDSILLLYDLDFSEDNTMRQLPSLTSEVKILTPDKKERHERKS